MTAADRPPFHPVLLGTDQGIYALAGAFHRSYGVRTTIVARGRTGAIDNSAILDVVETGEGTGRQDLLDALLRIGRERTESEPDVPLVLMWNSDSHTEMVALHADELEAYYRFPRVSPELLQQMSDKQHFAEVCERVGLPTPRTSVVSFADADDAGWAPSPVDVTYPVVAKPANSAYFENLRFPGWQKVWFLDTPEEWADVVELLRRNNFRGDFLVQELIPGDDTHQLSIVAYMDRSQRLTAVATAQVLLGEHEPSMVGNPVAMITTPMPDLMDAAEKILREAGWWGFANIDAKKDSRTGEIIYMEMNPRMGRNSFYATAAGADIAGALVDDVVHGVERAPLRASREVLYSIVAPVMLLHYVRDADLRRRTLAAARNKVVHPLLYEKFNLRRQGYVVLNRLNHVRKFRQHYPRPTESGF